MTALQFGLTPKTKPLAPKRSAMVAALDVGTSKIACLIARLKPNAPPEVLHRRSHSVEVLGFGHTLARGMKAGSVVDLAGAEEAMRQAIDLAERSAKMQLESVVVSMSACKPDSELISASVNVAVAGNARRFPHRKRSVCGKYATTAATRLDSLSTTSAADGSFT